MFDSQRERSAGLEKLVSSTRCGQICQAVLAHIVTILWFPFQHSTPLQLGCRGHIPSGCAGEGELLYRLRRLTLRGCKPASDTAFTSGQLLPLDRQAAPCLRSSSEGSRISLASWGFSLLNPGQRRGGRIVPLVCICPTPSPLRHFLLKAWDF